jgi:hypothetical protein
MNSSKLLTVLVLALAMLSGCTEKSTTSGARGGISLDNVSAAAWNKLAGKRIFFGHQSVGYNIIDGVVALRKEYPSIRLTIIETANSSRFDAPVFAHARVGKNTDPGSKCEGFEKVLESGIGNKADIAFFKFCYVDVNRDTDVEKMFESYKATVRRVKSKYPKLTLVHITVPLTVPSTNSKYGIKVRLKNILKRVLGRMDENVPRGEMNERIRGEYSGVDPIFDLASIESTSPAGESVTVGYKGKTYPALYPGYSTDGGHLNDDGKRAAAIGMLRTLLRVVEKDGMHP